MKKVIVFGSTGFIGSRLASALSSFQDMEVTGLGSCQCDLLRLGDARRAMEMADSNTSVVFCSAITRDKECSEAAMWKNILMVRNFLSVIPPGGLRSVIFLSSSAVFGEPPSALPIDEDTALRPTEYYGFSKVICEELFRWDPCCVNFPVMILRPVIVYGEGDRLNSLRGKFVRQLLSQRTVELKGGGEETCDLVHVDDLVDILCRFVRDPQRGILNVASGQSIVLKQMLRLIGSALSLGVDVNEVKVSSPSRYSVVFDNRRLRGAFPDLVFTPLEEGIHEYVRYARGNVQHASR
ncbi:MAG: NAD(P)-dependent oxidoreductase [Candidatus Omnitrophica bacterium]|nr:NAD(P)-dependent oxidoreductase [Candidatus Omnitrophota bacterium]